MPEIPFGTLGRNPARPHVPDVSLLRVLGLVVFEIPVEKFRIWTSLGTTRVDSARIEVYVSVYPACYWKFEIVLDDDSEITLSAGSGCLADYWPFIVKLCQGFIEIEDYKPTRKEE